MNKKQLRETFSQAIKFSAEQDAASIGRDGYEATFRLWSRLNAFVVSLMSDLRDVDGALAQELINFHNDVMGDRNSLHDSSESEASE